MKKSVEDEQRVKLFYERKIINGCDCFILYHPEPNGGNGLIGLVKGFKEQFKTYRPGRPWNLEEQLINQIINKNPNYIKLGSLYSAQLIMNGKPVEEFEIKNYIDC